ncbi:MAG TPA: thioredoxin family protein [Opitutaceae bacterium]
MEKTRKIEVFTAGCPLCNETLERVRTAVAACGCEVVERRCTDTECCDDAKNYGVRAMPSVIVDGEVVFEGRVGKAQASLLARSVN